MILRLISFRFGKPQEISVSYTVQKAHIVFLTKNTSARNKYLINKESLTLTAGSKECLKFKSQLRDKSK